MSQSAAARKVAGTLDFDRCVREHAALRRPAGARRTGAAMRGVAMGRLAAAAAGVIVLMGAGFHASERAASAVTERLEKQLPLKAGGRLTLRNGKGDIEIRSWDRDVVEVRVEKTSDVADEMALVPINITATDDEIVISSEYPLYAPRLLVRTHYRLRVPAAIDLRLVKTIQGTVDIAGVTGRAVVRVDTGAVKIDGFSGLLDVMTSNGQIEATLASLTKDDSVYLDTYNGDILLTMPKLPEAYVALQTMTGVIDSGFAMTTAQSYSPKIARGPNTVTEPVVRAVTVNGNIRLAHR
jgi:hypothetical protein